MTLSLLVKSITFEAEGIVSLDLRPEGGEKLPPFTAGAHIDLALGPGLSRSYSLANPQDERHRYVIGVLYDSNSRGGSAAAHALKVGDEIRISPPRNHFPLQKAGHTILVAGGIGVTPLLAMAEKLLSDGDSFDLHLCTRSSEHTPFAARWSAPELAGRVHFHHDGGEISRRLDFAELLGEAVAETQVYVCGPCGFIDAVLTAGRARGFTEAQLHREYFSAPVRQSSCDGAFSVILEKTGLTVVVPEGVTVVNALRQHGIEVAVSCEQGVCGSCLTRVTAGTPDHRDMFLTDEEHARNDQMTLCCSRSLTASLTLDI